MTAPAILFSLAILLAVGADLRFRRIPNWLNVTILASGLAFRLAMGGLGGLGSGLAAAALGLAILFVPFQARWIGAADVKLLAATGAWLGPIGVLWTALFGLAGGTVLAGAMTLTGGATLRREVVTNLRAAILGRCLPTAPRRAMRELVPMAVPLGIAAIGVAVYMGGFHA